MGANDTFQLQELQRIRKALEAEQKKPPKKQVAWDDLSPAEQQWGGLAIALVLLLVVVVLVIA